MIWGISKTTVNGVLALLITVGLALLASGSPLIGATATAVITLVLAVLRAVVGFLQTDAVPTVNTSSKIPPAAMLAFLAMFLALPSLTACKGPTANAPLAPGYANQADETMGQTLAGARSFYTSIATAKDLTDAEKTALNDLGKAINVAEAAYTSFHAGQVTQAAAQAAVDQVTAKQNAVEALGVKP